MQYLLIDGNNLGVRAAFANESLTNSDGIPSGVHYGVFNSLITLKKRYPNAQMLIAWDGKSEYRVNLSKVAHNKGLVPDIYKGNRKKDELPKALANFYSQSDYLKKGIGTVGIPQIFYKEHEADDVLATYAKTLSDEHDVIIITSDKDYYQMLKPNVVIYDGMKQVTISEYDFKNNTGLEPSQWVDVGALMGDSGDNIFGVPGWGDKTAIKEIIKYKTYTGVIEAYEKLHGHLRVTYPDLNSSIVEDVEKFEELANAKSEKGKLIYPEIDIRMLYTGVLYAHYKGLVKVPKAELMLLVFKERVNIAYKLKKSIDNINVPEIVEQEKNEARLMEYFDTYDIDSLRNSVSVFFGREEKTILNLYNNGDDQI